MVEKIDTELMIFLQASNDDSEIERRIWELALLLRPYWSTFSGTSALRKLLEAKEAYIRARTLKVDPLCKWETTNVHVSSEVMLAEPK